MASPFDFQFQIISDIHLETSFKQSYEKFHIEMHASNLCLVGDINLARHAGLYLFLELYQCGQDVADDVPR